MVLTDETSTTTIQSLLSSATSVLTWLIDSAKSIIDFMLANPLVMVFIAISLAFVGFRVVSRVIHR